MYNINGNENTSLTERLIQKVNNSEAGKDKELEITLINNKKTSLNNIKILGTLPTTGNKISEQEDTNTLETKLTKITASNATIYYTENSDATADIEKTANKWTTDLTTLKNAKLYLIKINTMEIGERYTAKVSIQMPNEIPENAISYTKYDVIYNDETSLTETSRIIGLSTSAAASIKLDVTAQVGEDILKEGDIVKEGEVIRYTVKVENKGTTVLNNVQLKLDVPEGTTYVRPIQKYILGEGTEYEETIETGGYVYAQNAYYEEITENAQLNELTNITISELAKEEKYTVEYEVRVNKGTQNEVITNKTELKYEEKSVKKLNISNIVEEGNIRVTVKRLIDESIKPLPGNFTNYMVYVENLTNSTIKNLELQILKQGIDIINITNENYEENISETIIIDEISAEQGIKSFSICARINNEGEDINISAVVKDSKKEKYRSNKLIEEIPYLNISLNMTSPQNGKIVKEGDTIEYNIFVKNKGETSCIVSIEDIIPKNLKINKILKNDEIYDSEKASNYVLHYIKLEPEEQCKINIITKVQYIPEIYNGRSISNMATALVTEGIKENSQVITHILKSNSEEKIENVISGYAWIDENNNGKRDANEKTLPNIVAKLYDKTNDCYISDENGNVIKNITDNEGKYTFSKIENGKYLVIFEYDTEKYELTEAFSKGVDTSLNSKGEIKTIKTLNGEKYVVAIEADDLKANIFNLNIGLKEKINDNPSENTPGETDKPENPSNPGENDKPGITEKPEKNEKKTISGYAWLDENRNGKKDENEEKLSGIQIRIYDVKTQKYLLDNNQNIIKTITDSNGRYEFSNIEQGEYILIFEYDNEKYEPTIYKAEGVETLNSSKVIADTITINGKEEKVGITDTIKVEKDINDINIGLKEKVRFDLELEKYISRVVVQNSKNTKAYEYEEKKIVKVEINKKQINESVVVIEYTIKIKNTGDISGYAKNVEDYLPNGLTFNSELNKDWYISGNDLHTKYLENTEIKPGEEKEIKLILTKTMTAENVGLMNNRAEIYEDYNKLGEQDVDSTPNNQNPSEDDMNSADIIIGISTGGSTSVYMILFIISITLISIAIYLLIKNNIINIPNKAGRR